MTSTARSLDAAARRRGPDKLAQQTARRIEAEIIRQRWPVGQSLGSETDLRERCGVSRAVVREAIRLLEHHQVATMRRGPSGGLFVRTPDPSGAAHALVIYLESVGTSLPDLVAARLLLESLAVTLSVERLNEQGIQRLRQLLAEEAPLRTTAGTSGPLLHQAIGELSGNPALELFIDILARLTERYAITAAPCARVAHAESHDATGHAHTAIAEAIIEGDAARAQYELRSHLEAIGQRLVEQAQLLSAGARPTSSDSGEGSGKLAEVMAERIRRDIVRRELATGDVLGSERDLLSHYEVSRSVFREAVRLLEYHSIAVTRRGPGGGLVVAEPDPQASIETIGLYLDYKQIQVGDLRVLRETLELGCVEQVARRLDGAEVSDRLRRSLQVDSSTPEDDVLERGRTFHTELAELSENPVLSVFLRVLMELWVRHSAALPIEETAQVGPFAPEIESIHGAIVEAILAGDTALAKHRMRRHLEALTEVWRP